MDSSANRFIDLGTLRVVAWIALLVGAVWSSASIANAGYEWTAFVLGVTVGSLAIWRISETLKATRRQFQRLLDAVYSDDLSLRFLDYESKPVAGSELALWQQRLQQSVETFQAHRARDAQEQRLYRSIVESVPVALLDVIDGQKILLLNRAARDMFRGSALTRVQDAPAPLRAAIEGMKEGERRMVYLPDLPTPSRFVLEILHRFHAGPHHTIYGAKDVTVEVQSTESATWSKVAQILAHEINNSLTPVTSLAQSMTRDFEELCELQPSSKEEVQELHQDLRDGLSTLGRRSAALMRFVDDYRKISQLPCPKLDWFSVRELLDEVKTLLLPQLTAHKIRLRVELENPELSLRADRAQVEQCLINLVKNASAACADAPTRCVTLCAGLDELGHPHLTVQDSGPGLSSEDLDRIFIPFFSTRASGTGIGLSVVRQIMQAHGGRVHASNRPDGRGASLRLTFVR